MCNAPSFVSRLMPSATSAETLPLGPSTRTVLPSTLYFTPEGSVIGFFPIRDIEFNPLLACESRELDLSFHCSRAGLCPAVRSPKFLVHSYWSVARHSCELRTLD